jgi:hypothetical protein
MRRREIQMQHDGRRWYERFPWAEVAVFVTAVSSLLGALLHGSSK